MQWNKKIKKKLLSSILCFPQSYSFSSHPSCLKLVWVQRKPYSLFLVYQVFCGPALSTSWHFPPAPVQQLWAAWWRNRDDELVKMSSMSPSSAVRKCLGLLWEESQSSHVREKHELILSPWQMRGKGMWWDTRPSCLSDVTFNNKCSENKH